MGVGGKRFRGVGGRVRSAAADTASGDGAVPGGTSAGPAHESSFVDEVRETRDPEYAADVRAAKRRRSETERARRGGLKKNSGRVPAGRRAVSARVVGQDQDRRGDNPSDAEDNDAHCDDAKRSSSGGAAAGGRALDQRTSDKILRHARKQRDEVREEELDGLARDAAASADGSTRDLGNGKGSALNTLNSIGGGEESDESEESSEWAKEDENQEEDDGGSSDAELGNARARLMPADGVMIGVETLGGSPLTPADELALAMFSGEGFGNSDGETNHTGDDEDVSSGQPGRVMLADIILEKIREKAEQDAAVAAAAADPEAAAREQKIAEIYGLVGNILAKYKSGRVPKAFKIIPKLKNWEHLLYLTRPDEWSPAACYAATRLLASNLHAKEVVRFYRDILLPRVLQDISENKKLNYHLYRALQKAVYKPDAFNKGIMFPLCHAGVCSLREATVIGSVLSRVSIPMLHSAAALLYIAEQPYALSNSVFVHALLDKKYALPYRVIDALVVHFTRMKTEPRGLPLVWHISLLTFARRYKTELEAWQKDELKVLMRVQTHPKVTPEIRRELFSARCRGEALDPDANTIARAIASAS